MGDQKPWYLSRTIWASLITVMTAVAGMAGISLEGVDVNTLTELSLQAVTAACGIVAILGRLGAKTRIG